ncbi:MAG TPA: DUF5916 domain-containing protein [Gemmatimonadales bacterium]|nr:DUF5916 domain-containing protein [Gemmatimonadales bacterium]
MIAPVLLALLQAPAADPGPVYVGLARQLAVHPPRIEASITVDGDLSEPVWAQAARLTGFSEYRPADGRAADDSTEVLVWYAPDAMYFGIRAYEIHGSVVRATLADRDNIDADDNVQILLDTYDDHRRALLFAVNPLGVQEDGVRSEGQDAGAAGGSAFTGRFDGVVDLNPDFVYQSKGHVTPWGYQIEVRIPFKSLHYQSTDPQTWGVQVVREVQHSGYEDTWTPVLRANASFLIQSGSLEGLTQLHRGLVMDLSPEYTTKVDGAPGAGRYVYKATPEIGGNVRWGVTQNLALSGTAHPDFSQIEADVGQVTLNQRFALFFPEKRPFFLEGLEQFDTPNTLIYTRQIGLPVAGAKLTGKVGATNVGYLLAVDDKQNSSTGSNPVFNILRVRHDLGASSTLGLAYTDRIDGDQYNRVLGADGRVIWRKIWFTQAQFVGSWTDDAAGARAGKLWDLTLFDRTGRAYGNHAEFLGVSPEFEARSGFVNRVNFVNLRFFNRFSWYGKPGGLVEQLSTFLGVEPLWRYDDFFHARSPIEGGYEDDWFANLRGGWGLSAQFTDFEEVFDAAPYAGYQVINPTDTTALGTPRSLYNLPAGNLGVTSPNRALTVSANAAYGATPIFAEGSRGHATSLSGTVAWRPTASLRIEARFVNQRISRARDGSHFSTENIPRLKIEYQLTRDIFFRYVGQYTAAQQDSLKDPSTGRPILLDSATTARVGPASGFTSNAFRNDVLFSYRPVPGTVIFLGYGASLTEPRDFRFESLTRSSDGFFLKASYLFRM